MRLAGSTSLTALVLLTVAGAAEFIGCAPLGVGPDPSAAPAEHREAMLWISNGHFQRVKVWLLVDGGEVPLTTVGGLSEVALKISAGYLNHTAQVVVRPLGRLPYQPEFRSIPINIGPDMVIQLRVEPVLLNSLLVIR